VIRKYHNKSVTVLKKQEDVFLLNVNNYMGTKADSPAIIHASRLGMRQSQMCLSRETLEAFVLNAMYVLGLDTSSVLFDGRYHKNSTVVGITTVSPYEDEETDGYKQIKFDCGLSLRLYDDFNMGAKAYFDLEHIGIMDFDGLVFDLSDDKFLRIIDGYGIELIPTNGHPVRIPGYSFDDGYYSANLDFALLRGSSIILSNRIK
jgi:hypothetical protein